MGSKLQIGLFLVSVLVFFYVLWNVGKRRLNIRYSIIWIVWSLAMVVISIFPRIVYKIRFMLGMEQPTNTVFLIMIFLLYCMSFHVFLIISKQNSEITVLNYEIANLKKELEEIKKK